MSGGTFDAILTSGMASIRGAADAAGKSVGRLTEGFGKMGAAGSKEFARIGQAVSKMGGPGGELGGKFFGAMGMTGGIRTLALAAVAAGVAFKTFSAIMEMATARAQAFAEAAAGIRSAIRSAADAQRSFAAGAVETGKNQAKAENLFGADAGGRAQMLGQAFGVETGDVLGAMAGSGSLRKEHRGRALEAALAAAATGEMTAADAMGMLSDPATRALILGQKANGGLSAAQQGAAQLILRRRGGHGPEALREALDTVGSTGPARARLRGIAEAESLTTKGQQAAFTSGQTEAALRTAATRALNPVAAAMSDLQAAQQEAAQKLMEAARRAGLAVEVIKEVGGAVGMGAGSLEGQARRGQIAHGDAVTGFTGMTEEK